MSIGRQHKPEDQKDTTSAAPAESDPRSLEQQTHQEVLPIDIASSSTPLPVLADLQALLLEWVRTPDLATSQRYLQAHPELLTEAAEQALTTLRHLQTDQQAQEILTLHQQLLQAARQHGVKAAYEPLLHLEEASDRAVTAEEELDAQVIAWLQMPDWETSQTYLQAHPQLLTETADQLLEALKYIQGAEQTHLEAHPRLLTSTAEILLARLYQIQQTNQSNERILQHQHLLRTAREEGIDAAYRLHLDPILLNDAAIRLMQQYQARGQVEALNRALAYLQESLLLTPIDSPDRPERLNNLGNVLGDRYVRAGVLDDLEAAIQAYEQALQVTPPDSPDRTALLNNLGTGLHDLYRRTGALDDLEAAIQAYEQALQATPPDSPDHPGRLNNLGNGLHDRYTRTGALVDLEAAIQAYEQALQATPPDSPDPPVLLSNLGVGLSTRYAQTGELADLEAAIQAFEQALQTTPADSPNRQRYLSNLGVGLSTRYAQTGELADLEAAIRACEQAVQATPPDSPDRPGRLNNLGIGLHDRYRRTGELADLEAAIQACEQAVQATPPDSPNRHRYLNTLGAGLSARYARTGNPAVLEAAIQAYEQAVQATPPDSPDHPGLLSSLGTGLSDRYVRTGELADLEAAIQAYEQAVQATPPDSPNRHRYLNNLGAGLRDRYARTGELADLEAAIQACEQAVQATPPDSPDRPAWLKNLGEGQHARYARSENLADLEGAITAWERSWSISSLRFVTLPVAYQVGQQRQGIGIAVSLVTAYQERAAHQHPSGPSARRRALEIAEGSKSRLLTQLVGRGPLPMPAGLLPQIAEREQQLVEDLTALDTQELANQDHPTITQEEASRLSLLQHRQALLSDLEELWRRIARLGPEGREYVALRRGEALTWQDLTQLAKQVGSTTALLSFFTTNDLALLFVLRAGWRMPRVVQAPLNRASWDDLLERYFREVHRYQPGLQRGETWDHVSLSILNQAQHYLVGIERLVLAPAGNGHLLSWGVLLERAGWYTPTGHPLPLVTLPALGVLPRLRQRPRVPTGPALVVGNPLGDLPFAEAEARMVAERFYTTALLGEQATKAAVLPRLADASLVHLATHAFFDPLDPLDSGIVLADGILRAREILEHRLQADLLVLSACESGQVSSLGGEELAGLSQAFLQAGVRSLLVSLWSVNDPATAALMQAFYDAREKGSDKAQALRQAMTRIQQDPRWSHPYYWGAFVLMGDWE